jgi:large subunit ribosomal protein L21
MFAVVQTGGKQYRVAVGQSIEVEKLPQVKGDEFEFDRVLLVGEGEQVTAGTPLVAGARVLASISRQFRGPKIIVFRYKSKKRVRVTRGHRQSLTQVFIRDIIVNGESTAARLAPVASPAPAPTAALEPVIVPGPVGVPETAGAPDAPATTEVAAPETTDTGTAMTEEAEA